MATPVPPDEATATGRIDLGLLRRLLSYLMPYAGWFALTLVFILISSLAREAGPYLTKIAVDDHMVPGRAEGLGWILAAFIGLLVVQFVLGYVQGWTTNMIGQWAMRDVRLQIFQHLQRLPLNYFDRTPVGRLMARNTSDVDALNELYTDGIVSLFSESVTVLSILGFIFYMDVHLGLLTCICLPISFATTSWLQRRTYQAYREARTLFARFAASLQESISGIDVVQLYGCEARRADAMNDSSDRYLNARLTSSIYHCAYFPMMELSGGLLLALVLWSGTGRVLEQQMEWGVLVAMMQYVPRFFMPMRNIAERFNTLQIAMASSERIFEILDSEPEPTGHEAPETQLQGSIEFRDVWFAYEDDEWVLRDVSFRVEPGQSLALVGATGAGKSTVIGLLCRFYDVQQGAVLVWMCVNGTCAIFGAVSALYNRMCSSSQVQSAAISPWALRTAPILRPELQRSRMPRSTPTPIASSTDSHGGMTNRWANAVPAFLQGKDSCSPSHAFWLRNRKSSFSMRRRPASTQKRRRGSRKPWRD